MEDGLQALHGGAAPGQDVDDAADGCHGPHQVIQEHQEAAEIAHGDPPQDGDIAAVADGDSHGDAGHHPHKGEHKGLHPCLTDVGVAGQAVDLVKVFPLLGLLDKGLDDLHAAQFFLDEVGKVGIGLLPGLEPAVQLTAHKGGCHGN